ncbi:MAG: hypothetical protein A2033_15690 [Bacteroidetes bacterium GWA2_31_9]|nr:MAG: hypothetical protein A2033_15690 [Bacteroidetes bacterium GWA2_31_9]
MKKLSFILSLIVFGQLAFGQAVHDRNVIPVAVNLNQVLRMTITNGGNIEFVFNSIDDYRYGLSADQADVATAVDADVIAGGAAANPVGTGPGTAVATNFYKTDFTVASSTRWLIEWGAEEATFIGTDDPSHIALTLDNVGFTLVNIGTHDFEATGNDPATDKDGTAGAELFSSPTDNTLSVCALEVYPATNPLIEDNDDAFANAGDATDNSFELLWRCGTTEAGTGGTGVANVPMNPETILNQGDIDPDRYVVNVVFELATDF